MDIEDIQDFKKLDTKSDLYMKLKKILLSTKSNDFFMPDSAVAVPLPIDDSTPSIEDKNSKN